MSWRSEASDQSTRGAGPEGAVDQVLRAYFHTVTPAPWPAWEAPAAQPVPLARRLRLRSRFALAASVAVLLGSQLWLAGFYRAPESGEAGARPHHPVDVAAKPQVPGPDAAPGTETPTRPALKNMR